MSIYKPAFERAVSDNDVTQTVRPRAVVKASPSPDGAAPPEVLRLRKAKPIEHLLPTSKKWLMSLPDQVRPIMLANRYPRIANVLALDWRRPATCRRYLDDLLLDSHRGNRQGFPVDVHRELEVLRAYYDAEHPLDLNESKPAYVCR
jgi:hypothetical protein